MLIHQPSVLISSALCLLSDIFLSVSAFPPPSFLHSHLSAQLSPPLHVSLINTFRLLTLLSLAILFVSFGPSARSPSLLPPFPARHFTCAQLPLAFFCLDVPTGLTFGMSTLTLICACRHHPPPPPAPFISASTAFPAPHRFPLTAFGLRQSSAVFPH